MAAVPFSKQIVVFTFGPEYANSAVLLPWLLGALVFILPNGVLTQAAIARNREGLYAAAAGGAAVINLGLNLALIPKFGGLGAAWATIVTGGVSHGSRFLLGTRGDRKHQRRMMGFSHGHTRTYTDFLFGRFGRMKKVMPQCILVSHFQVESEKKAKRVCVCLCGSVANRERRFGKAL